MGQLSATEQVRVEQYIVDFPELEQDYIDIQRALHAYAAAHGVVPLRDLSAEVLQSISNSKNDNLTDHSTKKDSHKDGFGFGSLLLSALIALGALYFFMSMRSDQEALSNRYAALEERCDSITNSLNAQISKYDQISDRNNTPILFAATDNYPETKLILHTNVQEKSNFLQITDLPVLESGQAFQLWSLKDGVDPIPLTVFSPDDGGLIPVDYEDGTGTYAITIEKSGGVTSPTLSRLIGTAGV